MGKQRIGVLLRESVTGTKSSNQWGDLRTLTLKYQGFRQRLRALVVSLQKHHEAILNMEATRRAVSTNFAGLSKATPIWDATGLKPSADHPADTVCSYASVHDNLAAKTSSYATKYKQFVIEYAVEWEKVVAERVDAGLKKVEELRRELDHYQKKTESIRLSVNQQMAKGKNVKSEFQEKLRRNEEKLLAAKQTYSRAATDLCILMEEVTERSWRDLHPLLIKCAQFDSTLSNDESKVLASLNQVVNKLKDVATANGISPQPRLKDLASLKPELLSTRPGGVSGFAIEAGPSNGSVFGTSGVTSPTGTTGNLNFDIPPGSTAASGLGGFPVQVASSEPPSTLSMLSISGASAPAPTFEDVYTSSHNNNNSLSIRSAPSSGNLPPLPPGRSMSFNQPSLDNDSVYSGYSAPPALMAPAPMSAPPPPPNAPPPPASYGMYGNDYNNPSSLSLTPVNTGLSSSYHGAPTPMSSLYGGGAMTPAPAPSWNTGMDPMMSGAGGYNPYSPTNYAQQSQQPPPLYPQPVMQSGGSNPFDH